jgi:hypothetical protein
MRTRKHPTMSWRRIPWPTKAQRQEWARLDDNAPPKGEPDGEFHCFATWVNKAPSWIGGTGAKCFDAKDRPCRMGADMMRARDEGTFPVRYYFPHRFGDNA